MASGKAVTTLINRKTGECTQKINYYDLIFDEEDGYMMWHNWNRVTKFLRKKLPDCFTFADRGRIDLLREYIAKDSQLLVHKVNKRIRPLNFESLQRTLKLKPTQLRVFLKKCKENKVLKEVVLDGIKYFALNPIYGIAGKRINLTTFIIFQEEFIADNDFPRWVIHKFMGQIKEISPNLSIIN